MAVSTNPGNPGTHRDVQGSPDSKDAGVVPVLHGATLRHAAAQFHAASLVLFSSVVCGVAIDVTARVFEEGFL